MTGVEPTANASATSCEDSVRQIDGFLDRELDDDAAEGIRRHLAECDDCAGEAEVGAVIRQIVKRSYRLEPVPPALLQRVTAWLHEDALDITKTP
jgi:anti-sigma factor (TIGR02949 family)